MRERGQGRGKAVEGEEAAGEDFKVEIEGAGEEEEEETEGSEIIGGDTGPLSDGSLPLPPSLSLSMSLTLPVSLHLSLFFSLSPSLPLSLSPLSLRSLFL